MSCVRKAVVAGVLAATAATSVQAGGLAVREQSTSAQGSSFAGSAAGYDLSSGFWNPAAFGIAGWGFYTESNYALIVPDASLSGTANAGAGGSTSTDIGMLALVPASYGAYRLNKDLVLGLSINSPFGLATKPDDTHWQGAVVGRTSKMFTANATPTVSYQIAPGLHIGAGVQFEYMSLLFRFASSPVNAASPSASADIADDDGIGIGYTLGLLWQPNQMTSIGLGFRSSIKHDMDGNLSVPGLGILPISATFENPEIVTLSIRQAISANVRLLGTIEWTNWSRFGVIPINGTTLLGGGTNLTLPGNWHDSWLFSGGLEYDVSRKLTVRTGIAFEKSPIQNADERLLQVPDSDRWWVSGGLTYKLTEKMAIDLAYTHIFFADAPFSRHPLTTQAITVTGEADQSADILSVSLKQKW